MTKTFIGVLVSLLLVAAAGIASEQGAYCEGFQQGYQSITGELASAPSCPARPAGSGGAAPFEQGHADGSARARAQR
jgi:hypothetical protein